ncbi:TRAP transporter small permease [Mailhella sp.]|uniref:TRAP transporter small permease n=1 Tax=Mailhella sp. TaxID=1981029 RepID=UPI0040633051
MKRFWECIDRLEGFFASCALWGFTVVAFLQVVMRYCFNRALPWPEEVCRYLLVCLVFFGISSVMKVNGHLRVEIVTVWLSEKGKRILDTISASIVGLFCLYLVWHSIGMTMLIYEMEQTTQSFEFPAWITWLPIPIGFALSFLQLIRNQHQAWKAYLAASEE